MNKKIIYFSLVAIIIVVVGWYFWPVAISEASLVEEDHSEHLRVAMTSEQIEDAGIEIRGVEGGQLVTTLAARGKVIIHPDKLAHILPEISGVAKETRKNIGDTVAIGEVLAVLESRDMVDARANYLSALQQEKLGASLYEREASLYQKKISSGEEYLNAKSNYEESKINLQLAKKKLCVFGCQEAEMAKMIGQNNVDLGSYEIRSPIEGVVIGRDITRGEFIESTTTIYELACLRDVWVEMGIFPNDLMMVKAGQMVDVIHPTEEVSERAKIIYLSPIIQEETITAKAIGELSNLKGYWRPGTFVKVNIATGEIEVPVLVSKEALQSIEGKEFVFVKVDEGFEKREVQVGRSDCENIEIISGLHPGEEYATSNTFVLKAGFSQTPEH